MRISQKPQINIMSLSGAKPKCQTLDFCQPAEINDHQTESLQQNLLLLTKLSTTRKNRKRRRMKNVTQRL